MLTAELWQTLFHTSAGGDPHGMDLQPTADDHGGTSTRILQTSAPAIPACEAVKATAKTMAHAPRQHHDARPITAPYDCNMRQHGAPGLPWRRDEPHNDGAATGDAATATRYASRLKDYINRGAKEHGRGHARASAHTTAGARARSWCRPSRSSGSDSSEPRIGPQACDVRRCRRCHIAPKAPGPRNLKHLRHITRLPADTTQQSKAMLRLAEPDDGQHCTEGRPHAEMMGFRRGYQCAEVFTVMRMERAMEVAAPACVAQVDLVRAYDSVRHAAVVMAMERRHVPRPVIAAYLRELRSVCMVF